jgi:hypothetical protein
MASCGRPGRGHRDEGVRTIVLNDLRQSPNLAAEDSGSGVHLRTIIARSRTRRYRDNPCCPGSLMATQLRESRSGSIPILSRSCDDLALIADIFSDRRSLSSPRRIASHPILRPRLLSTVPAPVLRIGIGTCCTPTIFANTALVGQALFPARERRLLNGLR